MATTLRERYVPKSVNPMRMDPPGTVTSMPSPNRDAPPAYLFR